VFTIEMLPAQRGDALSITYGEAGDPHHVLIDGGPKETLDTLERRIAELPGSTNRLELLVVTHIDADHIQGVVSLLSGPKRVKLFRDVWFNGFKHLGLLGGPEGEMLTAELDQEPGRWNKAFKGGPLVLPDTGKPPTVKLRGGLELTLLTPDGRGAGQAGAEVGEGGAQGRPRAGCGRAGSADVETRGVPRL
jgi:glyoxylase-like metal-dependent hydrolase (beta-lactamase superfamily II)